MPVVAMANSLPVSAELLNMASVATNLVAINRAAKSLARVKRARLSRALVARRLKKTALALTQRRRVHQKNATVRAGGVSAGRKKLTK